MFVEDLTPFFAEFGIDALVGAAAVRVIFDEPGSTSQMGDRGVSVTQPQVTLPTASVPTPYFGVSVTVPGKGAFKIAEHAPDGTGLSVLYLERVA